VGSELSIGYEQELQEKGKLLGYYDDQHIFDKAENEENDEMIRRV